MGVGLAIWSITAAHFAVQLLGFTFEPLQCSGYSPLPPMPFDCGLTSLTGTFTFDDANGDGHIVLDELLNLTVRDTISAPGPGPFWRAGKGDDF